MKWLKLPLDYFLPFVYHWGNFYYFLSQRHNKKLEAIFQRKGIFPIRHLGTDIPISLILGTARKCWIYLHFLSHDNGH